MSDTDGVEPVRDAFTELLPVFVAGLMDRAGEERLRAHLDHCPSCRLAIAELSAPGEFAEEAAGHIEPAILARWDQAQRSLVGIERSMIRLHLERCRSCRAELELLGYAPALAHDLALEGDSGSRAADGVATALGEDAGPTQRFPRMRETQRLHWGRRAARLTWAWGGWAAAAAALLLVTTRPPQGPLEPARPPALATIPEEAPKSPESHPTVPEPGVARAHRLTLAAVAELPIVVRGASPTEVPVTLVDSGTRWLAIAPPDLSDRDPQARVAVRIIAPGGQTLASMNSTVVALVRASGAILLETPDPRLAEGTYRLVVIVGPMRSPSDTLEYPFRVEHRRGQ